MWYVGMKVVCVRGGKFKATGKIFGTILPLAPLETHAIYTVRELFIATNGTPCLTLFGLTNPIVSTGRGKREVGYRRRHFRPLLEKKTDISIFQKLLLPEDVA